MPARAPSSAPQEISAHCRKVLDLLEKSDKPLSAYDILDGLRDQGFRSPPTVYRALEQLTQRGLAHRLESLNAYVACQHSEDNHDAHSASFAICTQCGDVQEIEDNSLIKTAQKLGTQFFAEVNKKVFELSGICHECGDNVEHRRQ